jgi:uncharacterized repeat protein (TIGR03803 family)
MRRFAKTIFLSLVTLLQVSAGSVWVEAQTFTVLHNFTGNGDGAYPYAGLTMDKAGNLYGTAYAGGVTDYGTVFKLTHKNSAWIFAPLYNFAGGYDGAYPNAGVILGPDGSLYGTTVSGGTACQLNGTGCGTVFNLRPSLRAPRSTLEPWTETVLYRFSGGRDGGLPYAEVVFDQAGNLYGTTQFGGGVGSDGVVYELMPSGGGWTQSALYIFNGGLDGAHPFASVIFDQAGNLYGTTAEGGTGGDNWGTVFQLTPSESGWTENVLYRFQDGSDGAVPWAGLIFDGAGNLYGATTQGGLGKDGTAFELTASGGTWTFSVFYSFIGSGYGGPYGSLIMDSAGNLYGTTYGGGAYGHGSVFKLTPSGGGWTETVLHDFKGGSGDGAIPYSSLVFDANGNLYGTASLGGTNNLGVVFEITP